MLSVDTRSVGHDLLSDQLYERLLRLAFSGAVTLAHASPSWESCLRVDANCVDARPVCLLEYINSVPGLSATDKDRAVSDRELLLRCAQVLLAVYTAGGHSVLQQPVDALSWLEPEVQAYLTAINADLVCVGPCACGAEFSQRRALAGSWRALQQLACSCAPGSCVCLSSSQRPFELADVFVRSFVRAVLPLFRPSLQPQELSVVQLPLLLPCKDRAAFPRANQDGGGIFSYPDWSVPPPGVEDVFRDVRHTLTKLLLELRVPARLRKHVSDKSELPLFTKAEVQGIRELFQTWLLEKCPNASFDWSVPDHQPYCLSALACLSEVLGDKDIYLFSSLLEGVPTGFAADIPKSHVFVPNQAEEASVPDDALSVCERNWKGAEENPEVTRELLRKELKEGWLEELPLEQAQQRWQHVAVGKLSVVFSALRKPRLIVDSTVCGTNSSCAIPERYSLPALTDVQRSFPLRGSQCELGAFSLDIKAAHKTIRIKETERGLVGVQLDGKHYWYRVCPFGANFSAHWFQRVSSFFVRAMQACMSMIFCFGRTCSSLTCQRAWS